MSTLPPFGAVALKLVNRIDEGGTSVQPSGVFHLIEGAAVAGGAAGAAGEAAFVGIESLPLEAESSGAAFETR